MGKRVKRSRHNPGVGMMPEVVDAGAVLPAVMDCALPQQVPEGMINRTMVEAAGALVEQKWGVGAAGCYLQPFSHVLLKCLAGGIAKRHPAGLSELAFGYVKLLLGAVEVPGTLETRKQRKKGDGSFASNPTGSPPPQQLKLDGCLCRFWML